ncbi:MAG: dephospho-CoA kinase [Spirochaetota bacterium]
MKLLGLTGGYCSGKNSVAALLEKRGWTSIDVDRLGHLAIARTKEAIVARFGTGILDEGGHVDRRALGAIVFSDPKALADHEAIVHPAMFALLDELVLHLELEGRGAGGPEPKVVVNAAILYKMPVAGRCDTIIEVRAPLLTRLARARMRDGLGFFAALARIRRQKGLWRLRKGLGRPVFFLRNEGKVPRIDARLDRTLAAARLD